MRVNVYAEEMTDRVEIVEKTIDGQLFTGLRFYLELPVTRGQMQVSGPFIHHDGDDDSSAVTFWGKSDLREALKIAQDKLDRYYAEAVERLKTDGPQFDIVKPLTSADDIF